jgi:hypothetical protein
LVREYFITPSVLSQDATLLLREGSLGRVDDDSQPGARRAISISHWNQSYVEIPIAAYIGVEENIAKRMVFARKHQIVCRIFVLRKRREHFFNAGTARQACRFASEDL